VVEALRYKPECCGIVCPNIRIWPPTRRRAVLWMIAQLVTYRTQQRHELTWQDYYDFLQRTKRKLYKEPNRIERVGHYLRVTDEGNIAEDNYYG
jgi:hypothetical protein